MHLDHGCSTWTFLWQCFHMDFVREEKLDEWMGAIGLTPLWGLDRILVYWFVMAYTSLPF